MPSALRNRDGKCHNAWFGMQMKVDKQCLWICNCLILWLLGFNKTLILQCCCGSTPAKIILLWKTLTLLQPKPVQVCCASYYQALFLLLQLWSFQSETHYFSICCNAIFLIHKLYVSFFAHIFQVLLKWRKTWHAWKPLLVQIVQHAHNWLSTQLWFFLLCVSHITQVSSTPKHTCGVCQCSWNLLCSIPHLTPCDFHFFPPQRKNHVSLFNWIFFSPHFHFYLLWPDRTRSRWEELLYNYIACCERNAYKIVILRGLLSYITLCYVL